MVEPLQGRVGNLARDQPDSSNCVIIAWDEVRYVVGVAVCIHHGDGRNSKPSGLVDGDLLSAWVHDEYRLWRLAHFLDATQKFLQPLTLAIQACRIFFCQKLKVAGGLQLF